MHRLLERTSRARADTRAEGACLDAETLAAWTDDSLTAQQRAAAETHAADCDRCLAVLAAITKTSPPPSATQRPSWLSIRWLVPLTTAAVAITAWVLVQGPPNSHGPVAPPATSAVDSVKPAEPAVRPERDVSSETRADGAEKKAASPPVSSRSRDQLESRRSADSVARHSAVASERPGATAKAPAPTTPERPVSPPAPAAAAPRPAAPLSRAGANDERVQLQAQAAGQLRPMIVSPDPDAQWRLAGTSVERSTDGGQTWRAQPTGAVVELLAGSSPAPTVYWIVGRKGTVLLSTDGETWRRLVFPEATVDLVRVTARDGMAATVTTSDGRSFQTTDAGRTWTLQEDPAAPFQGRVRS